MTLTPEVLKSYLRDLPRGHVFDLNYDQFAAMFPPGDAPARERLQKLADEAGCGLTNNAAASRYELTRR